MRSLALALALALSGSACHRGEAPRAAPAPASPSSAAPSPRAPLAHSDQYAFLRDLRAAQASDDPRREDAAYAAVAARWRDQVVVWHVLVPRALCRRADACYALPFDHADPRAQDLAPILEGWMPRLELGEVAFRRLDSLCGDAATCSVDVAANVKEVTLSTELPTAVALDRVQILAGGPPAAIERWTR